MSGPKVVRVVTREERQATSQGLLAQLDQALAQWQNKMTRYQRQDALFWQSMQASRTQLAQQLAQDQFAVVDQMAMVATRAVQTNINSQRAQSVAQRAEARAAQRARQDNARTLRRQLAAKKIVLPPAVAEALSHAAQGVFTSETAVALHQAFIALQSPTPKQTLNRAQTTLLERMAAEAVVQPFSDWVAEQQGQRDPRFVKLDGLLAELSLLNDAKQQVLVTRLATIEAEADGRRQNLLLDSLLIDVQQATQAATARQTLIDALQLLWADLAVKHEVLGTVFALPTDEADLTQDGLMALLAQGQAQLAAANVAIAATHRRQTVLQGLASLGYEVHEGMNTLWAAHGRVSVRNPVTPGYGVELGGQGDTRLQVRTVRFTDQESVQRDIDAEQLWCGDFTKLRQWLAQQGDELVLEQALAVGQVAVKQVADSEQAVATAQSRRINPKVRRL